MRISLYTIKRALLAPRTAYMRRRERKDLDHFERSMLELHYYSRAMSEMRHAMEAKPDLLSDVDLDDRSVVLDVGAYHGEWSETIAQRYGSKVYAFEPVPTSFPELATRLAGRPNVVAHDYGLGGADLRASLSLAGLGSTIFAAEAPLGSTTVRIRDVVAVLDELGLVAIDLMKINIEGGEYDLLDRLAATSWLSRIRQVMVQFHEWHPKAYGRRRRIRRALRQSHREVWCYPWIWELWRRDTPF